MSPSPAQPSLFPAPASKPATAKWISAHCDGGARGNPGPAGFGALIQDADGAVLAELSEFLGIQTNNFAEYSGLLASLDFALTHGHRRLRVVSDSELMVKQIQGKYQVKSPILRPLFDQAKKKIAQTRSLRDHPRPAPQKQGRRPPRQPSHGPRHGARVKLHSERAEVSCS